VPYVLRKRRFAAAYTPDIEIGAMRIALHERAANEPGCAGQKESHARWALARARMNMSRRSGSGDGTPFLSGACSAISAMADQSFCPRPIVT
jgi:hypothetical protein